MDLTAEHKFELPFRIREQHREWFGAWGEVNEQRDTYVLHTIPANYEERAEDGKLDLTPAEITEEVFLDEVYFSLSEFWYGEKGELADPIWKGDKVKACDDARNELVRLNWFVERLKNAYLEKGKRLYIHSGYSAFVIETIGEEVKS